MNSPTSTHALRSWIAPVRFMFSRVGRIVLKPREGAEAQDVWDAAIDAGAEDINSNPDESTREVEVSPVINFGLRV